MIIENRRYKGIQLYKVKKRDEYLVADHNQTYQSAHGGLMVECYTTVQDHERLPSTHCAASAEYLRTECYALSYQKAPDDVRAMLRDYVKEA